MRCKTIAYELHELGRQVVFLVSDDKSRKLLEEEFQCRVLGTRWDKLNTKEELEIMKVILAESEKEEKEIPALFVDSYFADNSYFRELKKYAKIIFLDDLAEDTYDVDVLINYNVTYEKYDYENRYRSKNTRLILGPDFVPLRRQFDEERVIERNYNFVGKPNILIMCGGGDTENAIYTILNFLRQTESFEKYYYYVVVGAYNPNFEGIMELAAKCHNVNILYNVSDMATVMQKCDMAIAAASTVLYECCAAGLPTAFFVVADNQEPDAEAFSEKYNLIYLGDFRKDREGVLKNIILAIENLSSNILLRKTMSKKMQEIVDGKGAQRIANLLTRIFEIGSFFEEEEYVSEQRRDKVENNPGGGQIRLWNDGRTAISAVLDELETGIEKKICFLPEYTCDTVILPFVKHSYEIHFYRIRKNLSIDVGWFEENLYQYRPNVILLHTYYGCDQLSGAYEILKEYKRNTLAVVIEDLTQSLFLYNMAVRRADFVVCSLRKWFAIPDGGFSLKVDRKASKSREASKINYTNAGYIKTKQLAQKLKLSYLRGELIEKKLFLDLNRKAEQMLYTGNDLYGMSEYAKEYLQNANIAEKREQRKRNAEILWEGLENLNMEMAANFCDGTVPLYVPIYVNDRGKIQEELREKGIYAPVLWPVTEQLSDSLSEDARYIYAHLLALPCDYRYDERDMRYIISVLKDL